MKSLARVVINRMGLQRKAPPPADMDREALALIERVRPFTMTTPERLYGLIQAVRYIEAAKIPGAIVECGVWRGGSMMAAALSLPSATRDLFLFDTYAGMPPPSDLDTNINGVPAAQTFDRFQAAGRGWCAASIEDVTANLRSTGYPEARLSFVRGRVQDTIPANAPDQIALLRLDTDWYESTKHELTHLYPRLARGGVLIIDDYGHWKGSRQATDEYFAASPILLNRLDYSGRIAIKL